MTLQCTTSVPNFGLHPWWIERHFAALRNGDIGDDYATGFDQEAGLRGWEEQLEALLVKYPTAGVGECGLDKGTRMMFG